MFQNINIPINKRGIEEEITYAQNEENRIEREILSPLPCQYNKCMDSGNIQIQDYPSDDSVQDPNYVNTTDSYSDSEPCDYSFQKENRKKSKLTKVNQIDTKVDPMISSVSDTRPISMITPIESHENIFNDNDTQPSTSKIVKYTQPSSSSSSASSDSSDSSDTETETQIVPTTKNSDSISYSANLIADNIHVMTNTSSTSNIIPQDENFTQSPVIEFNTPVFNQTDFEDRDSSIEPVSVNTTSHDKETDTKIGRKRKANPMNWISMKAKVLRNHGKSYVTKKNKVVPERRLKTACGDKCKFKCKENITELQRQTIFEDYWDMGDLQRQREFIMRHISVIKPRYSYKVHNSNRGNNFSFYLSVGEKKNRVCKAFFKATLDINDRVIKTVIQKTSDTAILEEDRRGKHQNHAHLDPVIHDGICKHLDSIPRIESHYCRANTKRTYIDGSKTVADLHRDYVADCKAAGVPFGNYLAYYNIFCYEYNMSFFQPKKDQCEDCANYTNATEEEKQTMKNEYEQHLKEKQLARDQKDEDKKYTPDNCIVSVYDLQAAMPCPKGDTSTFYYVSKLNCYNFTICDLKTKEVSSYVWHEGEAKRGAIEIGSCVLKYIESLDETSKRLDSKLDLIFYSDNCCGQQKNHYLMAVYIYAVHHFDFINSIIHKFLIKGHTQNEGDSVHSVIERQIQRSLRSGAIFTPDQYTQIIRSAKKTGNPYKVHEMSHSDFYDVKNLATAIGKNYSKNSDKEAVKITNIKMLKVEMDDIQNYTFSYKTSYEEETFKKVVVDKVGRTRNTQNNIVLTKAYTRKMTICEKKKKGLLGLIRKNTIPKCYSLFYENL